MRQNMNTAFLPLIPCVWLEGIELNEILGKSDCVTRPRLFSQDHGVKTPKKVAVPGTKIIRYLGQFDSAMFTVSEIIIKKISLLDFSGTLSNYI